jgi:hypothetical protein
MVLEPRVFGPSGREKRHDVSAASTTATQSDETSVGKLDGITSGNVQRCFSMSVFIGEVVRSRAFFRTPGDESPAHTANQTIISLEVEWSLTPEFSRR